MHKTNVFIVDGADLEYAKINQINYQIKLLRQRNVFKLLFLFVYFLGVKLCQFNALHNPSSSQHYVDPHNFKCIN